MVKGSGSVLVPANSTLNGPGAVRFFPCDGTLEPVLEPLKAGSEPEPLKHWMGRVRVAFSLKFRPAFLRLHQCFNRYRSRTRFRSVLFVSQERFQCCM